MYFSVWPEKLKSIELSSSDDIKGIIIGLRIIEIEPSKIYIRTTL